MAYKHLSLTERHYIKLQCDTGFSRNKIAQSLSRSQSSVSREINRNIGQGGYHHKQAHSKAEVRHKMKTKYVKLTEPVKLQIANKLREDWSPEQIAGRFETEGMIKLHHETIYQFVLKDKRSGGTLYQHLRHQKKTYGKRYGSAHNRTGIPNRVDIDQRPRATNARERIGDFEADTIIGKQHKGAILTLDDRKSKLRFAAPLSSKKANDVKEAMIRLLKPLQQFIKTITYDNGKEFTEHDAVAKALQCNSYFAKPYHSWERGQNENANGLLRQYFPKSMSLDKVTDKEVFHAIDRLNSRPRKCLGFKTPYEVFKKLTRIDVRKSLGYALMT